MRTPSNVVTAAWRRSAAQAGISLRGGRDRLDEVADLVLVDVRGDVGLAEDADALVAVDDRQPSDATTSV